MRNAMRSRQCGHYRRTRRAQGFGDARRYFAVNFLFINASNQLGQFESGVTAALFGAMPAVVLGGARRSPLRCCG